MHKKKLPKPSPKSVSAPPGGQLNPKDLPISRQRLEFIIEAVGIGVWSNKWPLKKLNWNRQMKAHFHLPPDAEIDVPTFHSLIHPEDRERCLEAGQKAVRDHTLYDFTYRTVAPDDSQRIKWVRSMGRASYSAHGQPMTFSGVTLDITAQHEMEEALRQSEIRFRTMAETIPDIIYTCLPDGQCDYINNRFCTVTGLPSESAKGFGWMASIHPEDAAHAKVSASEGQAAASPWSTILRLRSATGEYRWFISKALPLLDSQGRIQKWFGCVTDIDDLIKMETALRTSEEQLRELNRELEQRVAERTVTLQKTVADLEAFTYTIAHDLRAPLRAQRGYANMLIEEYGKVLGKTGQHYAQSIATAAERLDLLVRDLLAHARLTRDQIDLAPVNLQHSVEEVLAALSGEIAAQKAAILVETPLLPVCGHNRLLNQILTNLLTNALKFVKPGVSPKIRLGTEPREKWVRLWVEDNGLGIPREYHEQIFGVFQRLHSPEEYPGTGIGLAIVKKATERMGGRVGVESQPGAGSRFWVELPPAEG